MTALPATTTDAAAFASYEDRVGALESTLPALREQIATLESEDAAGGGAQQLYGVLAQDMPTLTRVVDFGATLGDGWEVALTSGQLPAGALFLVGQRIIIRASTAINVPVGAVSDLVFTATKGAQSKQVALRIYCAASSLTSPYLSQVDFAGKAQVPTVDDLGGTAIIVTAGSVDGTSLLLAPGGSLTMPLQETEVVTAQVHLATQTNAPDGQYGDAGAITIAKTPDGRSVQIVVDKAGVFLFLAAADGTLGANIFAVGRDAHQDDAVVAYTYTAATQSLDLSVSGQAIHSGGISTFLGAELAPFFAVSSSSTNAQPVRVYAAQQQLADTSYISYVPGEDYQTLLGMTGAFFVCPDVHVEQGDASALVQFAVRMPGNRVPLRSYSLEVDLINGSADANGAGLVLGEYSSLPNNLFTLFPSRGCQEQFEVGLSPNVRVGSFQVGLYPRFGSLERVAAYTGNIIVHAKGSLPAGYIKRTPWVLPALPTVPDATHATYSVTEDFSTVGSLGAQFEYIDSDINYMQGRAVDPFGTGHHSVTQSGARPNPYRYVPAANGDDAHLELRPVDCRNDPIPLLNNDNGSWSPKTRTYDGTTRYVDANGALQYYPQGTTETSVEWGMAWLARYWQPNELGEYEVTIFDRQNVADGVAINDSCWEYDDNDPTELDLQETPAASTDSGFDRVMITTTMHKHSSGSGDVKQSFAYFDDNPNRRFKQAVVRRRTPGKETYWGFVTQADGSWKLYMETVDCMKGKRFAKQMFQQEGPGGGTGGAFDTRRDYSQDVTKIYPMVHMVLSQLDPAFLDIASLNVGPAPSLF